MKKNRIVGIGVVIAALAVLVAGGIYLYPNYFNPSKLGLKKGETAPSDPNVVATVDGENIYLKEYKERLFAATGAGTPETPAFTDTSLKEPVLNELISLKIVDKELAQRNIAISDSELAEEAQKAFGGRYSMADDTSKKAYRDFIRLKVGKEKLGKQVLTWKKGFVLYCRYDRVYSFDMKDKPGKSEQILRKQKPYAKMYCQNAKKRLESGRSNFKKELARLKADKVLGQPAWKPMAVFWGQEFSMDYFSPEFFERGVDFYEQLTRLSEKGYYILDIRKTKSTGNMDGIDKAENAVSPGTDVMVALVYIKDSGEGEAFDFDSWISGKIKQYNVKKYPERIKI